MPHRTADEVEADQERPATRARRAAVRRLLTCDQNLRYQQNRAGRRIAILELSTNKLRQLIAAAQVIREAVAGMERGEFRRLHVPDGPS